MSLTSIIGLEIHVQLKTKSKMFCACDNSGENQPPNTTVCPVCMGHPGVLPVANKQAIAWTISAGLALHCDIPEWFQFERKNYFYPDLPKGYQITSSTTPPCRGGYLEIATKDGSKKIRLNHIHLEEDAAKNFHSADGVSTLVDYNRASTPLMEIVTEADLRSPQDAKLFLQELRLLMRYLGVSDADMEKGHLRCDANVSLTDQINSDGSVQKFYPKTEVKNINSFKAVERALEYEIKRQTALWQDGKTPDQETRGWNEDKGVTEGQRVKEEAHDYRYFPEPDIPPINFSDSSIIDLEKIRRSLPELPQARRKRFIEEYDLPADNVRTLVDDKSLADFFEETISELRAWLLSLGETEGTEEEIWQEHRGKLAKLAANWLLNKLVGIAVKLNKPVDSTTVTPENFAEFITLLHQKKINATIALAVLEKMIAMGKDPSVVLEEENLQPADLKFDLDAIVNDVIQNNQTQVEQYKKGKLTVIQYLIGQVMKKSKGQANPEKIRELLVSKLS